MGFVWNWDFRNHGWNWGLGISVMGLLSIWNWDSFIIVSWRFCIFSRQKMQLDVDIEPTLRFPHMTSIDKQKDPSGCRDQGPLNFSKNIVPLVHHGAYCALVVHIAPSWCTSTPYTVVVVYNVAWVNSDRQTDRQTDRKRGIRAHRA